MRSIKELLQVMLENQQHFEKGLCQWIGDLYADDVITKEEYFELDLYRFKNKPVIPSWWRITRMSTNYWWQAGDIKPRLKWIHKHIAKQSENGSKS